MMDWDRALTLLHVATTAQDYPKLHDLRNAALAELETMMVEAQPQGPAPATVAPEENGVRRA